jgi:hypothetical protein
LVVEDLEELTLVVAEVLEDLEHLSQVEQKYV